MTEPTTQAGRALLADFTAWGILAKDPSEIVAIPQSIAAIEAEAAEAARAEVREASKVATNLERGHRLRAEADLATALATVAALRKWIDRLRGFIAAGERLTPELLDELKELLAATPADWLAKHDEKVRAEADGWDAMLAQTAAIRPIIDAEIERRDRIAAGDKTAGTMPPAEWDALASLPAVPNLPGRYLDLASPDAERRMAAAIRDRERPSRDRLLTHRQKARAILAALRAGE